MAAIFKSLCRLTASVSTRTRIMAVVIFLLFFLGGGITLQTSYTMKKQLTYQLEQRALSIARDVSHHVRNLVTAANSSAISGEVEKSIHDNSDISYLIIKDDKGRIVYQFSRSGNLPEMEGFPSNNKFENERSPWGKSDTVEASTLISGQVGGVVSVGMPRNPINREVWIYVRRMMIFTGILLVIGLIASFYFIHLLTRPLKELIGVTRSVASGDLQARAIIRAGDDIGKLGESFNSMITDLEKAHKDRQTLWNEVKKREETKGQLLEKVIKAQEEERKRVARELHDETSQSMASFMVGLKMLEQEVDGIERKRRIKELREMASTAMDRARDLALELRPSSLDDLGLISALEQYSIDFGKRFGVQVDFQAIGFNGNRLSPEKEVALYRIVQEALINVARHSGASSAGVIVEYRDKVVKAIVEDNGCGFDIEKIAESSDDRRLGILGMQERATLAGGKLSLESSPGEGTTVFVEIPL